ncbi:MAG: TlpA family protein disulfide reductase [Tannerella sp.]|jgi:thiol-disulfide isomerase/thioredoxin|nr:TlpA family protein disulfide reductase [Tannerella sp.]
MTKLRSFVLILVLSLATSAGCRQDSRRMHNGVWRAELTVAEGKKAPFLFEIQCAGSDSATLTLINGEERVPLTGLYYAGDTLIVPIDAYDAAIKAVPDGRHALRGRLVKNYIAGDTGTVFTARYGDSNRFAPSATRASIDIDGKWDVLFIHGEDTTRNAGIFSSNNGIVTGSILTSSGDFRYLEGAVTDSGIVLSAFGGLSPYLFELEFADSHTFRGVFYTARGKTLLAGRRNPHAGLPDLYDLTHLKSGYTRLGFRLPNTDNDTVSLADARYRGKAVIVSVLGSWCPNCLDEIQYLAPWYRENRERGVEIVGLAFERKDDFAYGKAAIERLKRRYDIDYEILFAGQAGKSVKTVLPEVENFSSYPTLFFTDRDGNVVKIHTGFSGPATGVFYEEFKSEFNRIIDGLLQKND